MTKKEHLDLLKQKLDLCHKIAIAKNADYCGEGAASDPFKNFHMVSNLGLCSVETGILVRMSDKMARISTLLSQEAQVKDESIQDTLLDLANYSLILSNYIDSKKN